MTSAPTEVRRRPVLVGAVLAAVLLVTLVLWFGRACWGGWWIVDSAPTADTYMVGTLYERWAVQVKGGHLPLWFPEFACGSPVHAAWMYGLFYPPLLLFAVLPAEAAWTWLAIVHVVFGAFGMYAFVWNERRDEAAAAVGAIVFGLSGFMLGRSICGHLNLVMPFAWAPWTLLHAARAARGERGAAAWLGLCAGLGLLAGHVQVWFYVAPAVAGYAVFEASRRRAVGTAAPRLLCAAALALGIAAIQWAPAGELFDVSGHPREIDRLVRACSATPSALTRQIAPRFQPDIDLVAYHEGFASGKGPPAEIVANWFRHEFLGLAGPLAVAAALLAFRPRDGKRWFWFAAMALGLLLALGVRNDASRWLNEELPPFSWARAPGRAMALVVLAGAVLAADVVADWTRGLAPIARALVPAAFFASALVFGVPAPDVVRRDFLDYDWSGLVPETKAGRRLHVQNQRYPYVEPFGVKTTRIICPVDPAGFALLASSKTPAPIVAWWLDVAAMVTPTWTGPPADVAAAARIAGETVVRRFETPGAVQRFPRAQPADDATAVEFLRHGERGVLFIPPGESPDPGDAAPQTVRIDESRGPDRIDVVAERPFAGWVLVPDKWYPGWRIENEGAASRVTRGNLAFLAVRMDPRDGTTVSLVYRPWWLWPALLASGASLVAAAALAAWSLRTPGARFRVTGTVLAEAHSSPPGASAVSGTLIVTQTGLKLGRRIDVPFAAITKKELAPPRLYVEWDSGGGVVSGMDVTLRNPDDRARLAETLKERASLRATKSQPEG